MFCYICSIVIEDNRKHKMITFTRRLYNWCRRFRHRCGYGVHSPSDFFLITYFSPCSSSNIAEFGTFKPE